MSQVVGAQQIKRCAHLSAKSSMSKMAACNSKCSRKKKTMMLLSASGTDDGDVISIPHEHPLARDIGEAVVLC